MASASDWSPGWPALLPLAGFAVTLALGIFVWSRRGNTALQRSCAALNIAVALWNLDVFLLFALRDGEVAARVDRLLQPPIVVLPFLALLFFFVFLGRRLTHPILLGFGAWAALLVLVSTGPSYLAGWRRLWFGWYGTPGQLYPLFVAYLVAYLATSSLLLAHEARTATEALRRSQALWLLAANLLLGLASLTNFLPLWGLPFLPLGNIASVAYVGVMAFTIARHRLLDAQLLFRAGMLYSTLTFLLTVFTLALVLGLQRWVQDAFFAGSLLLPMIPALAVGLAVGPLKVSLQERLDRTFFRSAAERRTRLEEFAAVLRPLEREERIWEAAWEHGWRHAHPEGGLVLRCAEGACHHVAGTEEATVDDETAGAAFRGLAAARRCAAGGGGHEVAVPVIGREGLLGGCLLGPKSSGEAWTPADLAFLDAIAGQAALAVSQARLRERVGREERHAALGRMAGVLSHEMRNPLNVIRGAAGVLRRLLAGRPGAEVVEVLEVEVARGERFIRDILFACGEHRPHLMPIDLALGLREFAERWACGEFAGVRLELDAPAAGLAVRGDAFQLRQVYENLARNAAEAGGGAGRIIVKAEAAAGGIAISVADDGPGIERALLPVIFEPFRTTKRRGTGLGLSIAKGIVERHGGRITAANRPGGGAVFRVWLPAIGALGPEGAGGESARARTVEDEGRETKHG